MKVNVQTGCVAVKITKEEEFTTDEVIPFYRKEMWE
jgi:hypothetical protein